MRHHERQVFVVGGREFEGSLGIDDQHVASDEALTIADDATTVAEILD